MGKRLACDSWNFLVEGMMEPPGDKRPRVTAREDPGMSSLKMNDDTPRILRNLTG
jgi:hypothetical protein